MYYGSTIVDTFGDPDVDGYNTDWEYLDGWGYRIDGTTPDGANFNISHWYFSGVDALDGETTNSAASSPFPIGSYVHFIINTTIEPSIIPSDGPSTHPSIQPSNVPTDIPSSFPTPRPTEPITTTSFPHVTDTTTLSIDRSSTLSTSESTTRTTSRVASTTQPSTTAIFSSMELNDKLVQTWNTTGTFVFFGFMVFGVIVVTFIWCKWLSTKKASDNVNLVPVIRYIHQVLDLWTDLSFCIVLYYQELYDLTIVAGVFVIVPYLMSIVVSIYSIFKWTRWRQDHPSRLKLYLRNYEFVMILFSLFGGFYATIDLFRSKIFYLQITYFPLKQSEYNHLKYLRFINFVLFENIPQFVIQLHYLTQHNNNESSILPIVFISISLTIISLLFGSIKMGISIMDECIHSPTRTFAYETKIGGNFTLQYNNLRYIHAFCHSKMKRCVRSTLNACDDRIFWVGRSDVFFEMECYHIDCEYYLNQLMVYFELKVFTMEENHKHVIHKLRENIVQMLDTSLSSNSVLFRQVSYCIHPSVFFFVCETSCCQL